MLHIILFWVGMAIVFPFALSVCTRIVCRAYFDERKRWLDVELTMLDMHKTHRRSDVNVQ